MSWTSKWRIPSVRFIASRVIAKTSGRTSSRAFWMAVVLARRGGPCVSSRRRSRSGCVRSSSDGSSGDGDLADLVADLGEPGPDLVVGEGLDLGLERVRLVDRRLDASDLAVVRVDETGKELHGTAKYTGRRPSAPSGRDQCQKPEPYPAHEDHERQRAQAGPEQHRHQPRRRLHLGVLERGQPLARQLPSPARRAELVAPLPVVRRGAARGRPRRRVCAAAGSSVSRGRAQQGALVRAPRRRPRSRPRPRRPRACRCGPRCRPPRGASPG